MTSHLGLNRISNDLQQFQINFAGAATLEHVGSGNVDSYQHSVDASPRPISSEEECTIHTLIGTDFELEGLVLPVDSVWVEKTIRELLKALSEDTQMPATILHVTLAGDRKLTSVDQECILEALVCHPRIAKVNQLTKHVRCAEAETKTGEKFQVKFHGASLFGAPGWDACLETEHTLKPIVEATKNEQ